MMKRTLKISVFLLIFALIATSFCACSKSVDDLTAEAEQLRRDVLAMNNAADGYTAADLEAANSRLNEIVNTANTMTPTDAKEIVAFQKLSSTVNSIASQLNSMELRLTLGTVNAATEAAVTETTEVTDTVIIRVEQYGSIVVKLDASVAPLTVANFQKLVSEKFYDGLIFHRVISGFMIQGGDPTGTGMGGSSETIKGEFSSNGVANPLSHTRGVISMARSTAMNSASSQFFIVHKDSTTLDGDYAAFGKVLHGIEVVDAIASVATDSNDKPLSEVKMSSIRFVTLNEQ